MRVRVFSSGLFPIERGTIDLPALPRPGDELLVRDPSGPVYLSATRVLLVEGADPIVFTCLSEGEEFRGLTLAQSGLTERGSLAPLPVYSPFESDAPLGL